LNLLAFLRRPQVAFSLALHYNDRNSTVGFLAMANNGDIDRVLDLLIEENSVVATGEPKAGERRPELSYITGAG